MHLQRVDLLRKFYPQQKPAAGTLTRVPGETRLDPRHDGVYSLCDPAL
jgi:hypothetical protein